MTPAVDALSRHPRDRLALDIAGLGAVINVQAAVASSEGFSAEERAEAFRRTFLAGTQLAEKLAELEPYMPKASRAGIGLAKDLKEIA